MQEVKKALAFLGQDVVEEILEVSKIVDVSKGMEILREGQYVKVIPVVIRGLIKVFSSFAEKDLLLYYIKQNESCIMSFAAGIKNEPSQVYAIAEKDSLILLMPVDKVRIWLTKYPKINQLFYQQYNLRYTDLLETINLVLFNKMDKRLYDYLLEKIKLTKQNPIKISHKQIALELGTAREVVSRVMKKLENDGLVKQHTSTIEVFEII